SDRPAPALGRARQQRAGGSLVSAVRDRSAGSGLAPDPLTTTMPIVSRGVNSLVVDCALKMTDTEVLDLFRQSGALLEGHFRLSSGLHSDRYLQSALVLQHPEYAERLGRAIAERTAQLQATAVLSPALGGIVIGQEVGRALHVRALFAERQDGALTLRRGFTL